MQTSDPDLVTKLSKEDPADPCVVTAAQGQLSAEDACVKTMGPLWVQGKGVAQGGQGAPPPKCSPGCQEGDAAWEGLSITVYQTPCLP